MGNLHFFLDSICVEHNIDINYILKTNVRKQSDFNIVKTLPVFYKEIFCSFNEAKTVLPFNQLNDDFFYNKLFGTICTLKLEENRYYLETG